MKFAIIANPRAGRGDRTPFIDSFCSELRALGVDASVELTQGPEDGVRLGRELSERADVLGILGGDGTIHEVVNGIMPAPVPIVVIPVGSGNDFASLFGCPRSPQDVVQVLSDGFGARIDVLDFGKRYCVNTAGLGFEGHVNQISHEETFFKGRMLYLVAVFKAIASLTCPFFRITMSTGEQISGEQLLVSIGNGNRTGGAFHITPDARPDDGLIDVCITHSMGRLKVLRLLPRTFNGSHVRQDGVRMFRVGSLTIESDADYPMHIDGEFVQAPPGRLEIVLKNRVLPVLCARHNNTSSLAHRIEKIL